MGKFGDSNSNKYCSVPQCKSRCTNEVSLFLFPKEESQRKKWADAIKIEKEITEHMRVCSRHFVKNDYILSDYPAAKVRRLKKSAVPSQNLPWQFPNKRVSPTLAKARMERLKNRTQLKISDSPDKTEATTATKSDDKKPETTPEKQKESPKKSDTSDVDKEIISTVNVTVDIKLEDEEIEKLKVEAQLEDNDNNAEDAPGEVNEVPEAKKNEKNDKDVPARAPTRLRQRKGVLKCEYCGRKCLTPQALQTHQQIAHKNARNNQNNIKKGSTVNNKANSSPKPVPIALISVRSPESLQQLPIEKEPANTSKRPEQSINESDLVEKVLKEDSEYTSDSTDSEKQVTNKVERYEKRKTEFECPKCNRRFAVYFMATKHIQKHHSVAQDGSKVPSHLISKPIRIEICTICNLTMDCDVHVCTGPLKHALGFICTGCNMEYKTLTLFDMHKSSMHSDGVESMFFPTLNEFDLWKRKMEIQTRVKYSVSDQMDTKRIHRCSHRVVLGTSQHSRQRLCPSTVVVQEFTKGFQVHYYPIHYDHDFDSYGLSNAFKKYSISSLMNLAANKPPDKSDEVQKETDLYLQFKKLTDVLVNEAARINVSGLKLLMRKALDMFNIVNSYVEDDEDSAPANSSIIKIDNERDDLQDRVKSALLSLKRRPTERIEATLVKRRKSVFQSTENTQESPTGVESVRIANSFSMKEEEDENKLNKSPTGNQSSFLDTFQDFVGKTSERRVRPVKRQSDGRKATVKTKMGQFKPSPPKKSANSSPKSNAVSPRTSIASVKDIEYEVKEQENDCNILILKI